MSDHSSHPSNEKKLVETIIKSLVDKPEEVSVTVSETDSSSVLEIRAHEGDYGKIIGRKGRIINSIRLLLAVAARESGKRWVLNVPDKARSEDDQGGDRP